MLIGPALAHGSSVNESVGGGLPLVILGAVIVFGLYFIGRAQWRKYKDR